MNDYIDPKAITIMDNSPIYLTCIHEWIKITDRLPALNERVLVYAPNTFPVEKYGDCIHFSHYIDITNYINRGKHKKNRIVGPIYDWHVSYGDDGWYGSDVTHWMPLPLEPLRE